LRFALCGLAPTLLAELGLQGALFPPQARLASAPHFPVAGPTFFAGPKTFETNLA
jgi:hypothetical protein